jgi:hypothetical protein
MTGEDLVRRSFESAAEKLEQSHKESVEAVRKKVAKAKADALSKLKV